MFTTNLPHVFLEVVGQLRFCRTPVTSFPSSLDTPGWTITCLVTQFLSLLVFKSLLSFQELKRELIIAAGIRLAGRLGVPATVRGGGVDRKGDDCQGKGSCGQPKGEDFSHLSRIPAFSGFCRDEYHREWLVLPRWASMPEISFFLQRVLKVDPPGGGVR